MSMSTEGTRGTGSAVSDIEPIHIKSGWNLEFEHAAGKAASRFLTSLADGVILASPCRSCSRVLCPPREFCERCFVRTADEWLTVGPEGAIEAFTVVQARFPGYREPPYALAYVRPEGASTALANYIEHPDLETREPQDLFTIGGRARAVFSGERRRHILDFHWELIDR